MEVSRVQRLFKLIFLYKTNFQLLSKLFSVILDNLYHTSSLRIRFSVSMWLMRIITAVLSSCCQQLHTASCFLIISAWPGHLQPELGRAGRAVTRLPVLAWTRLTDWDQGVAGSAGWAGNADLTAAGGQAQLVTRSTATSCRHSGWL